MIRFNLRNLFLGLGIVVFAGSLMAQHADSLHHAQGHEQEHHATEENAFGSAEIIHHVSDDLGLHIIGDFSIPLPVIIYEPGVGLDVFSSSAFHHAHGLVNNKYYYHHGKLVIPSLENGQMMHDEHGHVLGKNEARLTDLFTGNDQIFYNFSITKNVFGIFLAMVLLVLLFGYVAKMCAARKGEAPKGLQNAIEPLVLFVRDEVVKPAIGEKHYQRFLPYLLTVFFFIWISNLLGLVPFLGGLNVTGNIAVTFTLAFMVLGVQIFNGNKNFWGHIFWFPGVPVPVKIVLAIIEFIGLFSKPFSLMIRLFANITAGHIIIMSIIGITFAFSANSAVGYTVGLVTSLFSVAMFTLELLVAAIQAYIFTLLASLMLGAAVEEHHHHEDHGTSHAH
jgi:F-type H+-transporting ATPase subunit a